MSSEILGLATVRPLARTAPTEPQHYACAACHLLVTLDFEAPRLRLVGSDPMLCAWSPHERSLQARDALLTGKPPAAASHAPRKADVALPHLDKVEEQEGVDTRVQPHCSCLGCGGEGPHLGAVKCRGGVAPHLSWSKLHS